jgi:catalase
MKVQVMSEKQAEEAWEQKRINVFDLTHIWPHGDYPLRTIGKFTLNENAKVSLGAYITASSSPDQ